MNWAVIPQAFYSGISKKAMKRANPHPSRRALLAAGVSALALSACESFIPGQGPPPRLYRLTPKSVYDGATQVNWQLVIEPPNAQASIDSPRIGLMLSPLRFDYYAQANWVDRAPLMVQSLIVESFDNSQAIVGVGREAIGLRPDYVLKSELREFQAENIDGQHVVNVALNVKLVQMPERQIVAAAEFQEKKPAPPNALDPVIAAFDEALGKVLKSVVLWTLAEGQRAEASRTSGLQRPTARTSGQTQPARPGASEPSRPRRNIPRLQRPGGSANG
jgi:cholesterol transport system auxiliary component